MGHALGAHPPMPIDGAKVVLSPRSRPHGHHAAAIGSGMDLLASPVHLGLAPTLHFHASGAVTYVGTDDAGWDDDPAVLFAAEA